MATIISTNSNLCDIDRLGELKAQIADLEAVAAKVAERIKGQGAGSYDGELYTACVTKVEDRWSADGKAIAKKLEEVLGAEAFKRFCDANQKKTAGYTSLKLSARN